ncbi:LmeA family phospholipid-binding protein [Kitasatospora purpeofusca]|uniref:LmeA family phospholipid-binding protein n=1 Tax=Kitasatospora purpeofusca TaxID=67352 RepID=UPI0038042E7C
MVTDPRTLVLTGAAVTAVLLTAASALLARTRPATPRAGRTGPARSARLTGSAGSRQLRALPRTTMTRRTGPATAPAPAPARSPVRLGRLLRPATRRGRVLRAVAVPVTALLALTAGAETVARHVLESRIADRTAKAFGTRVEVDTGSGPALLKILDRHLDHVTLSADNARLGGLNGASARITLDDVRFGKPAPGAAEVSADITIPADALAATVRDSGQNLPVGTAHTDPATGTIQLGLGAGGTGQLTLKPALVDGSVTVTATALQFLGRTVTGPQLDRINERLTTKKKPTDYPLGLEPTALAVTPTGLTLHLAAGPTTLDRS